ncbi:MAG TPA: flagellin [Pirellulales bacterium]|nr:flagellin [Pirellulales bacterium]
MSRINTNISSLLAQTALANSQTQLQTSLTQLSTGFQINTGADNPAGLIASQVLQTNITGANAAITNSQTADELIATADSALGQISSLLDSINGLVSNSANTGAESASEIAANQLQVDSSLQAIDQISQTTSFGGENILNGSLNFLTSSAGNALTTATGTFGTQAANAEATGNFAASPDASLTLTGTATGGGAVTFTAATPGTANGYSIQYTFASAGPTSASIDTSAKTVTINVASGATAASVVAAVAASTATSAVFNAASASSGAIFTSTAANGAAVSGTTAGAGTATIVLSATNAGTAYNGVNVTITQNATSAGAITATYTTSSKTLTLSTVASTTANQIINKINATGLFSASTTSDGTSTLAAATFSGVTSEGAQSNQIQITAVNGGTAYNGVNVVLTSGAAAGHETASYTTSTKTLTIATNANSTTSDLVTAINNTGLFTAKPTVAGATGSYALGATSAVTAGGASAGAAISNLQINQANFGTQTSLAVNVDVTQQAKQAALVYSGGALASATVLQLGGDNGYQVLNFAAGTTISQIESAVNQSSDSTGVSASVNGSQLTLSSTDYGSNSFVSAQALSGSFATHTISGNTHTDATYTTGVDTAGTINGQEATGNGLSLSLNSTDLNVSFNVNSSLASNTSFSFDITGGGANFQLGPNVVSAEQIRLGIPSVSSANLGGTSGSLYTLQSGGANALATNPDTASAIVQQAINQVADLRGRLGAFQSDTLQTNINALTNTVNNLTSAQSNIQDTNFATATANLTRAQILVQSGTSVLQIANQQPQQVLALLKGAGG